MRSIKIKKESKKAKRDILPFFIPMEGCRYQCIYCDQHAISGEEAGLSTGDIIAAIDGYQGKRPFTVAFYGGTFTALSFERQNEYLFLLEPYILQGTVDSVRLSTRPDCVDEDILDFLNSHHVDTIELGVQSFFDDVLHASGRHYRSEIAESACQSVKQAGFKLGIQLMTGLPKDNYQKSLNSMEKALSLNCDMLRIYPTLVLKGTPLARLYQEGGYKPQTLDEAVNLCSDMLVLAERAHVPVIRMGLNPSINIEASLLAGPYHPAFGNMVHSNLKREQIKMLLEGDTGGKIDIYLPQNELPQVFGQDRCNLNWLKERYNIEIAFHGDDNIEKGALISKIAGMERKILCYDEFIDRYYHALKSSL